MAVEPPLEMQSLLICMTANRANIQSAGELSPGRRTQAADPVQAPR